MYGPYPLLPFEASAKSFLQPVQENVQHNKIWTDINIQGSAIDESTKPAEQMIGVEDYCEADDETFQTEHERGPLPADRPGIHLYFRLYTVKPGELFSRASLLVQTSGIGTAPRFRRFSDCRVQGCIAIF